MPDGLVVAEVKPTLFDVCVFLGFSTVMAKPWSFTETLLNRLALEKEKLALDPDLLRGAATRFLLNSAPV